MHIFCIRIMVSFVFPPEPRRTEMCRVQGNNQILVKLRHTKIGASAHLPNIIA